MQPQESRRYSDEKFYFDQATSELVITSKELPPHYPQVELVNAHSTYETYRAPDGSEVTRECPGQGARNCMEPNSRLIGVEARNNGDTTSQYTVQPGDKLIARRKHTSGEAYTVTMAADKPLPAEEDVSGYEALGIITTERKLVMWGYEGSKAQQLVDHLVASKLTRNLLDNFILDIEVKFTGSMADRLASNHTVRRYLDWFQQTYGENYKNLKEPFRRWAEFNGKLTREQIQRYQ